MALSTHSASSFPAAAGGGDASGLDDSFDLEGFEDDIMDGDGPPVAAAMAAVAGGASVSQQQQQQQAARQRPAAAVQVRGATVCAVGA